MVTTAESPLRLSAALQLALAFQVVLYLVHHAQDLLRASGVLGSAAVAGLMDVDALTYSIARLGGGPMRADVAALALTVEILANTLLKLFLTLAVCRGRFRWIASASVLAIALGFGIPVGYGLAAMP